MDLVLCRANVYRFLEWKGVGGQAWWDSGPPAMSPFCCLVTPASVIQTDVYLAGAPPDSPPPWPPGEQDSCPFPFVPTGLPGGLQIFHPSSRARVAEPECESSQPSAAGVPVDEQPYPWAVTAMTNVHTRKQHNLFS